MRHTPLTEEELITGAAREVTAFQQLAPFAADSRRRHRYGERRFASVGTHADDTLRPAA
ncbi:MAG: hypothetical protein R2873_31305 [Caldilineaceae bacterium]